MMGSFCFMALGMMLMAKQSIAFSGVDFSSIFPDSKVIQKAKISTKEVHDKVNKLEKRFNESLQTISSSMSSNSESQKVEKIENRMTELQKLFEGIKTSKVDAEETQQEVVNMAHRLNTIEQSLSSASVVKSTLDDLQSKVTATSEETMKDVANLKKAKAVTDQETKKAIENLKKAKAETDQETKKEIENMKKARAEADQETKRQIENMKKVTAEADQETKREIDNLKKAKAETDQETKREIENMKKAKAEADQETKKEIENLKKAKAETDQETKREIENMKKAKAETDQETKREIENMKKAKAEADQKVASLLTDVKAVKSVIQGAENQMTDIREDVHKLKVHLEQPAGPVLTQGGQNYPGSAMQGGQNYPDSPTQERPNQPGTEPKFTCPRHYRHIPDVNICVKVFDNPWLPQNEAKKRCESEATGGRLVVLDSPIKLRAVQRYLEDEGVSHDVFINGKMQGNRYLWSTDQPVVTPWCPGEPGGRPCISLWQGEGFCLDDSWCHNANPYVCEVAEKEKEIEYY